MICGKIVIIINVIIKNKRKGNKGFTTFPIFTSLTPQATNRQIPTGGVIIPIPTFAAIKIPKWIGSIPSDTPTGKNIGIKTIIAGKASITMPSIRKTKCTRIINIIQLSAYVTIIWARAWGILSNVRMNENIEAVARTNNTTPDKLAVFINNLGMSSNFSSL